MINKVSKRQSRLANILTNALVPLTILSLTYIVLAKEPDLFSSEVVADNTSELIINIQDYDISEEFYHSNTGIASYYGKKFHNRRTSSGERYNMFQNTAAHRSLPFGTIVRITNLANNQVTLARINDRGPFIRKRIIDLSYQTAKLIDGLGLPKVKIEALIHPKSEDFSVDTTTSYFFGYSYDKPLICIPKPLLEILDSTNQFEDALMKYDFHLLTDELELYIFVPIEYNFTKEQADSPIRYYIATVKKTKKQQLPRDVAIRQ